VPRPLFALLLVLLLPAAASAAPPPLSDQVDTLLATAHAPPFEGDPLALLVPSGGSQEAASSAATVYKAVEGRRYQRVVLLCAAPTLHSRLELLTTDLTTPLGRVAFDSTAGERLRGEPLVRRSRQTYPQLPALYAQLPLLQRALQPGWRLVPLLVGQLDPRDQAEAARLIGRLMGADTLVVVSGDVDAYGRRFGYTPFAADAQLETNLRDLDLGAYSYVERMDLSGLHDYLQRTRLDSPLFRPLPLLLANLPSSAQVLRNDYRQEVLDEGHRRSYLSALVSAPPREAISPTLEGEGALSYSDLLLAHELASRGLEAAVLHQLPNEGLEFLAHGMPEGLMRPAGVFITLSKHGQPRGQGGALAATRPLYAAILEAAREAALRDRRFYPLSEEELAQLEVEVNVVNAPQPLADPLAYPEGVGLALEHYARHAVLLPSEVAAQGLDPERTLSRLATEAGLRSDGWRESNGFQTFTTQRIRAPYLPR